MSWLLAWIRFRVFGGPPPGMRYRDWDPEAKDLHDRQHRVVSKATALGLRDEWSRLQREAWRRQ